MKLVNFFETEEETPEKKSEKIKLNFFRLICCIGKGELVNPLNEDVERRTK